MNKETKRGLLSVGEGLSMCVNSILQNTCDNSQDSVGLPSYRGIGGQGRNLPKVFS